VFEIEHLGRFTEDDYDGDKPHEQVRNFRTDKIITALNRHAWHHRDEEFRVADVNPKEIPVIKTVLGSHDWEDIRRTYDDFDPRQWDNPPSGTQTADIKAETIENLQEMYDYTAASAELTSRHVMSQVSYKWD
jgi:predicted Ser/Thr protein kinase